MSVVWDNNLALFGDLMCCFFLPVPRLLFDGWSYQDYMSVLSSEDEIEELASELVNVAKVIKFSLKSLCSSVYVSFWWKPCRYRLKGLTASLWNCGASWEVTNESESFFWSIWIHHVFVWDDSRERWKWTKNVKSLCRELVHMVKHICETLKAKRLDCVLVIPPAVTR